MNNNSVVSSASLPTNPPGPAPNDLIARCQAYIVLGLLICAANGVAGTFFAFSLKDWKKYFLFIMLCASEMVNGIQYIVIGAGRLILIDKKLMNVPISSWDCMVYRPWVFLAIVGAQLPAALHTCLAIERVMAVYWSVHYASMQKFSLKVKLGVGATTVVFITTAAAVPLTWYMPGMQSDQQCTLRVITWGYYGTVHFTIISGLYVLDVIVMFGVLFIIDRKRKSGPQERRRHYIVACMSMLSVITISFPSCVTILWHYSVKQLGELLTAVMFGAPGVSPCLNPLLYFFCLPSYRQTLTTLYRRLTLSDTSRITNVSTSVTRSRSTG